MPTAKSALRILAALWMLSLTPSAVAAQQEDRFPEPVGAVQTAPPKRSAFEVPPSLFTDSLIPARRSLVPRSQTAQPRKCRAGRRALIGALIGAGASIPLARLAHDRFENEAASGPKAAATTVLLSAGAGALIGLATCR
jgi:hypothetical protein